MSNLSFIKENISASDYNTDEHCNRLTVFHQQNTNKWKTIKRNLVSTTV